MAMSRAFTTSVEACVKSTAQPSILRLQVSRTTAQSTSLSRAGSSEMSVTYDLFSAYIGNCG